jgi:hypothetical protein
MPERGELTRENFLAVARQVGLDAEDPHMDQLFPEVAALSRVLRHMDQLDLSDEEPITLFDADED